MSWAALTETVPHAIIIHERTFLCTLSTISLCFAYSEPYGCSVQHSELRHSTVPPSSAWSSLMHPPLSPSLPLLLKVLAEHETVVYSDSQVSKCFSSVSPGSKRLPPVASLQRDRSGHLGGHHYRRIIDEVDRKCSLCQLYPRSLSCRTLYKVGLKI